MSHNEFIENQTISLLFEMQFFSLLLEKPNMTINELKQQFIQQFIDQEKQMDLESYECQDLNGIELLEQEIIQDIINTTKSSIFKLVKVPQTNDNNNHLIEQQNPNNQYQELKQNHEQNFNHESDAFKQQNQYHQSQNNFPQYNEKLLIKYKRLNISLFNIQDELTKCKYLKKLLASELKDNGIIFNADFCELFDEKIIPDDQDINPKHFKSFNSIILIDQKEMMEKQPEQWGICITRQQQINNQLARQLKINEKANLKITLDSWKEKEKSLFKIFPLVSSPNISRIFIIGPKNTPYSDGIYELLCKITEEYPFQPPQLYFVTQIYHPNIANGALPSLESFWKPTLSIESVILQIISYLSEPSLVISLNKECAFQYQNHRDIFNQIAEGWKNKYANPNLDDIIKSLLGSVKEVNPFYDELLEEFEEWIIHWVHQTK